MSDDFDVLTRLTDYHDHIAAPTVHVADDIRRGRRRVARRRTLAVGGVALIAVGIILTATLVTRSDPDNAPEPAPSPIESHTAIDPVVGNGPSEVLAANQAGRFRLEVAGEVVPGRWVLDDSRRDVWVAGYFDAVGYGSPALWWGKGTTTHEVPGYRGGVAISQDAHWIVWTRATSGFYDPDPNSTQVMEVVDTSTGEVRWSRGADADAADIGALAVTNDGVVVFAHCNRTVPDPGGWPACNDARLDVWAPRSGVTSTVSTETQMQVTGAHNGFLISDAPPGRMPSVRPQYVHVSESGDIEVVATLPRSTAAVTADERFALLSTECTDGPLVCGWSVLPLDGGEPRPMTSLAKLVSIATGYDWPVNPFVVERADLLVVRDLGDHNSYPAVARCSLAQARCVRIKE